LKTAVAALLALGVAGAACRRSDLPGDLAGTLLFVSDRGGREAIYLRRLPHGADFLLVSQFEPVGSPALSPSGREVAFTMRGRVGVANVETREVRFLTHAVDWQDESPSWRPDGRALVVSARSREGAQADLHLLPLSVPEGGEARRPLTRTPHQETEAVFTPDGSGLVFVREERLFRLDLTSGEARPLTRGFRAMRSPRFLPDGRLVALWTEEKQFGIDVLAPDGSTRETLVQGTEYYRTIAPSPDGRYLAASLAFRTDALSLRQNESVVLLDARGRPLGTLAESWRSATGAPFWGR
jgi:Tol biopolymer transport system component